MWDELMSATVSQLTLPITIVMATETSSLTQEYARAASLLGCTRCR